MRRPTVAPSGSGSSSGSAADVDASVEALFSTAVNGELSQLKGIMETLGKRNGSQASVLSLKMHGYGVLHVAASAGHLEVCKYLVEGLGADGNITADNGMTPFIAAAQFNDLDTVKYFLEHGADLMKADEKGGTALHEAARHGCTKVTEFLLSKGIPVDIDYGRGTPLHEAATNGQDKTLKILLDHHANPNIIFDGIGSPLMGALLCHSLKCMELLIKAGTDVNSKGSYESPLVVAIKKGGYTNEIRLLLKTGADPNIPDDFDRLPVELAVIKDCMEEVELLFPLTSPIPGVPDWSIGGVIWLVKLKSTRPLEARHIAKRKAMLKSVASNAFNKKDYDTASSFYGLGIDLEEDATLYSNRSLCRLRMGDGEGALSDAYKCRMMRPRWAKAYYRQENNQACIALLDAQKLDPGNEEIERELRKAVALRDATRDDDQQ
ncbi:unnamed protein product [Urochloa decumbens]|uniref:Uncharacterized protein n=1 Tax=Urochloa decumbens TaxID=240449 RepID=A0ABC9C6G8_9POAL